MRILNVSFKEISDSKRNKYKSRINQPRLKSAIDFRPLAVLEPAKVNKILRLVIGPRWIRTCIDFGDLK